MWERPRGLCPHHPYKGHCPLTHFAKANPCFCRAKIYGFSEIKKRRTMYMVLPLGFQGGHPLGRGIGGETPKVLTGKGPAFLLLFSIKSKKERPCFALKFLNGRTPHLHQAFFWRNCAQPVRSTVSFCAPAPLKKSKPLPPQYLLFLYIYQTHLPMPLPDSPAPLPNFPTRRTMKWFCQ